MPNSKEIVGNQARVWFITGTSSGLGRQLTKLLLANGERVAATARTASSLNDLQTRYGEQLWVRPLDVTDASAVHQVVGEAFRELGRVDVIVSNAGYALFGAAEEVSDDQIKDQINTNLLGSIQLIRAALPHLRVQGSGRILQVSSMGGQIARPGYSLYHATKWGIEGFVEAVAQEVAPFGIEFTIVEPGGVKTSFITNFASPPPMAVYENTPVDTVRRAMTSGRHSILGDAMKVAQAMINSVEVTPAPIRLTLGSDSYALIRGALGERLAALDAQKVIAISTDTTPLA